MNGSIRRARWLPQLTFFASTVLVLSGCAVTNALDNQRSLWNTNDGYDLLKAQDYEAAKPYFQRALQIDPQNQIARVNLGVCYQKLGEPEAARQQYLEVIEYTRDHPDYELHTNTEGAKSTVTEVAQSNLKFIDERTKIVPVIPTSITPRSARSTHD